MVVHSYYPADPRVRRETEALLEVGWAVDVVCLRGGGEPAREGHGRERIYRLSVRRHRGSGVVTYLIEYLAFFLLAAVRVTRLHLAQRYDVVQAHNMPDFLVFTAALPKLLGARAVLDIHDPVPELYALKFAGNSRHPIVRLIKWVERRSIAFADEVITVNEQVRRRLVMRSAPPEKVTVVMNSADPQLFHPIPRPAAVAGRADRFTLMYHGSLTDRHGVDIAIRAVDRLRATIPGIELEIYGQGEEAETLGRLTDELALNDRVRLHGQVPIDRIPEIIAKADLGVVPIRQNPFTELGYPTKTFEYLAVGVPVIVSRTGAIAELFAGVADIFFQPEDVDDLAGHILTLYQEPERRERMLVAARQVYATHGWEKQRTEYLALMGAESPVAA